MAQERTFQINDAKREAVPLFIGLVGPSGSGKTGSALELAHGIQDVMPGDIGYIDTEANRALHYANAPMFSDSTRKFKFKHLPFAAPFNPESYKQAIGALIKAGCKTIIVDSMSHEHDGPGGVLEMHEAQLDKIAGNDFEKRNKSTFLAWAKPKAERRALINFLLQQKINVIACFRAKEKLKITPGKPVVDMGWQPIAGEEFVFEMTLNCLLLPGSNGIPTLVPENKGELQMVKVPQQFRGIVTDKRPLSASLGKELAVWAKGDTAAPPANPPAKPAPVQVESHPADELLAGADKSPAPEPEFELDGAAPKKKAPGVQALELNKRIDACESLEEVLAFKEMVMGLPDEVRSLVAPQYNAKKNSFKGA